jgi:hypothetical protein
MPNNVPTARFNIAVDEYELEIVRQALRAYRSKLLAELDELIETSKDLCPTDNPENNPDVSTTREWLDRLAVLRERVAPFMA